MIDREKIIKAVAEAFNMYESEYEGTSYFDEKEWAENKRDALFLLKEQDAIAPIPPTDESDLWKCGNCNHQLFRCTHQRYCEMCGKEVKWDG